MLAQTQTPPYFAYLVVCLQLVRQAAERTAQETQEKGGSTAPLPPPSPPPNSNGGGQVRVLHGEKILSPPEVIRDPRTSSSNINNLLLLSYLLARRRQTPRGRGRPGRTSRPYLASRP